MPHHVEIMWSESPHLSPWWKVRRDDLTWHGLASATETAHTTADKYVHMPWFQQHCRPLTTYLSKALTWKISNKNHELNKSKLRYEKLWLGTAFPVCTWLTLALPHTHASHLRHWWGDPMYTALHDVDRYWLACSDCGQAGKMIS